MVRLGRMDREEGEDGERKINDGWIRGGGTGRTIIEGEQER